MSDPTPTPVKPLVDSKVFWANVLGGVVIGAQWLFDHSGVLAAAGVSPTVIAEVMVFVNIILRFKTTGPVKLF